MITIHFIWYWFLPGMIAMSAAFFLSGYVPTHKPLQYVCLILMLLGTTAIGLSVTRDLAFVTVFAVACGGVLAALLLWAAKTGAASRRIDKPQ
jgi:hypothetical protein